MNNESLIAHNVRLRMEEKGFGPKALSLKAGLNETYVRDILKGRSLNPRQAHLQSLASALECRVSDLTGEVEQNSAKHELAELYAAIDTMTDEQRRALLVMIKLLAPVEKPDAADPNPAPRPKRRPAA